MGRHYTTTTTAQAAQPAVANDHAYADPACVSTDLASRHQVGAATWAAAAAAQVLRPRCCLPGQAAARACEAHSALSSDACEAVRGSDLFCPLAHVSPTHLPIAPSYCPCLPPRCCQLPAHWCSRKSALASAAAKPPTLPRSNPSAAACRSPARRSPRPSLLCARTC